MARKYSRDNRGRFASTGTGATARGGRLKTASGGKRATQTMTAKGAGGAGVMKGRPARTVAGQSVMRKLARGGAKPAAPPKPTRAPGSRIQAPKIGGVSRTRLSGLKMNEGAGRRGAARQQRRESMAMQRQMLGSAREKTASIQRQVFGRVKPGRSAEPLATGGTLAARASLGRARAKAGPGASPAQRGAVKRAGTYLKASRERNRTAVKGAMPKGTMAKPKGQKPGPVNATQSTRLPAAQRPGSLTNTLGKTLRSLAMADAARIRDIESITGQKIRRTPASAGAGKEAGARVRAVAKGGKVSDTLRAGLRELAQSDARTVRGMASIVRDATPKVGGAKGGKAIGGGKPALAGGKAKPTPRKPSPKGPGPRTRAPRTAGTVAKPKGLKQGAVTARVKAKAVAANSMKPKTKSRIISSEKALRVAQRINKVVNSSSKKTGIKRLNSIEVGVRAKEFALRKAGGMKNMGKLDFNQQQAAIRKSLTKPTRYGTGQPNRNKPTKYDKLGQSAKRQQRTERMKSGYDNASIARRAERVRKRINGKLVPQKLANAVEIYAAQLDGRMARGKGAELPGKVRHQLQNARTRQRPDGSLRFESARTNNIMRGSRPSYGAPVKAESKRIQSASRILTTVRSRGSNKTNARGRSKVIAKAKMDPMQRSEAAYQKRKHGVHSTIKNPGRPSLRAPRRTTTTGARIAVRGSRAATQKAYRARITPALSKVRTGSLGMGIMRRNPRIRAVDTGMRQLSLVGKSKKIVRYRPVK